MANINIHLLLTGDEIMSGDIIDSNSAMIADHLATLGLRPSKKVTVGDQLSHLIEEMQHLSQQADVLIVNGGLGPTEDDKTAEALAQVLGLPLAEHAVAIQQIEDWCQHHNYPMNDANRKQGILPKDINIIENSNGSAPGFYCEHNHCLMLFTPGVPSELNAMLKLNILPMLNQRFTEIEPHSTKRLQVFGIGESSLQLKLREQIKHWPEGIELGFRAAYPQVEVKLTAQSKPAEKQIDSLTQTIKKLLSSHVIGEDGTQLPELLVQLLAKERQSITTVESCTGGLIASKITSVAGSSSIFGAGFVTYSNEMKTAMVGVSEKTLVDNGAVSEPVVIEMAKGALAKSGSDWAIAVSGVAGPSGGTKDKPVGTVWVAWGNKETIKTVKLFLPFPRQRFQEYVASAGLDLIRRELLGVSETPYYFSKK
ncbi:CinA family nicotinamide mononucleotide deamidase-related protein [Oceaniserpentilla sp. 4NH20-0058]|uniref:CinA family nicotinamide mononucleotide deamidase-related protein n=1 Tax=Oceaniserpentilla sp. 4NH20-0058 TaxID=3127660 RepID=UPI0031084DB2